MISQKVFLPMHDLAPHFEKRVAFRSMSHNYARSTLRDLYGIIEYYRSLSLDWWFINLEQGLQLRCGRRELDEEKGHPFLFATFLKRDIMLRRTICTDYLGAPFCPDNQLLGPNTLANIHRRNQSHTELPDILRPRTSRPGHLPDDYRK
ncbi:hypothetical protein CFR72_12630 [Gluconacetobacter entanii]|uniref:Uncharacterized protein n=2 Tax=Gluconacetobacter entanii TaxID=108528 RepID=A0A318PV27_9PROT|nr:hypothetical protein CFR72_12630 [Gluconacetobacter entanii]